jgi:hypothetical protein
MSISEECNLLILFQEKVNTSQIAVENGLP